MAISSTEISEVIKQRLRDFDTEIVSADVGRIVTANSRTTGTDYRYRISRGGIVAICSRIVHKTTTRAYRRGC